MHVLNIRCDEVKNFGEKTKGLFSSKKFCKNFQILCHIESLDTCMKH
jgi:hypothetical protein